MARLRLAGPLMVMAALLSLGACSNASPTPAPRWASGEASYLYAAPGEVMFVSGSANGGSLHGTVQWLRAGSEPATADFSATASGSNISFEFWPGPLAGWTGAFEGTGLVLTVPDTGGAFRTIGFRVATPTEFEELAAPLR